MWGEAESESDDDDAYDRRVLKQRRKGSEHGRKFASAVAIAVDVKEALSRRMEHAIAMWRQLETIDAAMLSGIIEAEPLLMFKLVDALLSTPYFPLQQFYFMALSGLLYLLSHSRGPSEARLLQNFIRSIQHFDSSVSKLLPLHEAVDWRRVKIDSWIDLGGSTLTFYQRQGKETNVINLPSACIEKVDRDVSNGLVYIYTKSSLRTDGASLFVLEPSPVDFAGLSSALSGMFSPEPRSNYETKSTIAAYRESMVFVQRPVKEPVRANVTL
ncbi:hypothetical protein Gpo141_00000866 [Globisporangium polare]